MIRLMQTLAVLSIGLAVGDAGEAIEARADQKEHRLPKFIAVPSMQTTLVQAISIAEQQTGGTAVGAELENEAGVTSYEVEVLVDDTVQEVLVSVETGTVIKVVPADENDEPDCPQDTD